MPYGTFDFGGMVGIVTTGNADTIIRRTTTLNVPGTSGIIPIEIVGLQLVSASPYDPDGPGLATTGTYFATLQSNRSLSEGGGINPSTGSMTADANGTFTSFFDVYFDLRIGALNGPIVGNGIKSFTGAGTWGRTQPTGSTVPAINGVDYLLNGIDTSADFWVSAPVIHDAGGGTVHIIDVPEPSRSVLLLGGLMGLGGHRRRK